MILIRLFLSLCYSARSLNPFRMAAVVIAWPTCRVVCSAT